MDFEITDQGSLEILAAEEDYLLVYKPSGVHTTPLKSNRSPKNTALDFCAAGYPEVLEVRGWHEWEGGAAHRLDFETQGLILFARNQAFMDHILDQQGRGLFLKEYHALCEGNPQAMLPGFPQTHPDFEGGAREIVSNFRVYGPGRKAVRPIPGEGYRTVILQAEISGEVLSLGLALTRGFRHQIRCHLAWIGRPILKDPLYGARAAAGEMALRARKLSFVDLSGEERAYSLPPLSLASG